MVGRFSQPSVGGPVAHGGGGTKVVQCPQHVVAPPGRVRQLEELLVCRLAVTQATEQVALEQVLLT